MDFMCCICLDFITGPSEAWVIMTT